MSNPLRKTMVYLGLADEELVDDQPQQPAAQSQNQSGPVAPVTPIPTPQTANRSSSASRTTKSTPKNAAAPDMNEILTVHPRQYRDAQVIAESFRDGIPVIINLSQMQEADARRLIDFASGLSQGLYGKIERVTNKVFLLSPSHIAVSGEQAEMESDIEASFFGQS